MIGQEYGNVNGMRGWSGRRRGKEITKAPTTQCPALTSPRSSDKSSLLWTSPLDWPWSLQFQHVQNGPIIPPSFSQTCVSLSTSHLSASHPSQKQSNIFDSFLFIHFHIYHLTSPTDFSFEIFFESICSSFFSKMIALALVFIISGLISLSLVSRPLSHNLMYLQCKSDPAMTLKILQWVPFKYRIKS